MDLGATTLVTASYLEGTRKVVSKALDLGVNFFDTSDNSGNPGGSETLLGQVFGETRKRIVLATKFGAPMTASVTRKNASRHYIMNAVEASLTRLLTDWIDLYQMHYHDALTPIEETLRALDDLVRQGKVRYIGCSNLAAWRMVDALWTSRHLNLNRLVAVQAEYSVIVREIELEMLPAIEANGMGLRWPGGVVVSRESQGYATTAGELSEASSSKSSQAR